MTTQSTQSIQYSIDIDELNQCALCRADDLNIKLSIKSTIGEVIDKLINIGLIRVNDKEESEKEYETSSNDDDNDIECESDYYLRRFNKREYKKTENSGFNKSILWSDDMYKFLENIGIVRGTLIPRTKITEYIVKYIKTNNLNQEGSRRIIPDEKLKDLLNYNETQGELNYFNLQKYLSQHVSK